MYAQVTKLEKKCLKSLWVLSYNKKSVSPEVKTDMANFCIICLLLAIYKRIKVDSIKNYYDNFSIKIL